MQRWIFKKCFSVGPGEVNSLFRTSFSTYYHGYYEDVMFNRCREMKILSNILMTSPQLSVITGPVNSGKTMLLEKVLEELPKKTKLPTAVHSINLRKGAFNSVESMVGSLTDTMNLWVTQMFESISISAGDQSLSVKLSREGNC